MSNKTQLQINNTTLDGYIARINTAKDVAAGLPEAGGGGNIETWTGTVYGAAGLGDHPDIYYVYTDENLTIQSICLMTGEDHEITIAANTVIVQYDSFSVSSPDNFIEVLNNGLYSYSYLPRGNNFEIRS